MKKMFGCFLNWWWGCFPDVDDTAWLYIWNFTIYNYGVAKTWGMSGSKRNMDADDTAFYDDSPF